MTQPSPLATPAPWNLVAPAYAEEVVPMFEVYAREALRLAAPPSGARVIDVACGPGTLSAIAAQDGLTVDAVDFSPAMIELLQARAVPKVTCHHADGQALPFEDGTFAAGFSMFGLMFFPDRAKGFSELRRVLAPGARAVVSSWPPAEQVPVMAAMFGAVRDALYRALGGNSAMGQSESPLATENACHAEMSVSFTDVQVHRCASTMVAPSGGALWESLVRSMAPIALMRKTLPTDAWAKVDEAARRAIVRAVGDGPTELTMTAWLSVGTAR